MIKIRNYLLAFCVATFLCGCAHQKFVYPNPEIKKENLEEHVVFLTSVEPSRNYKNIEALNASATYISEKLTEYQLEPIDQKYDVGGLPYRNIIASVATNNSKRIVVGAHYDVCGSTPGADDNASAIAGLLEIARFAKEHEEQLNYRIDFVAYTLEEPPFFGTTQMGSYIHAQSLKERNVSVKGMICLEMIGFYSSEKKSQQYPLFAMKLLYPNEGNFIAVISNFKSSDFSKRVARHLKKANVNVEALKAPSFLTGVDFSDHRNYWNFGYDAVMITDTSFYRNPNYHQSSDTIETINFEKMSEVVKGLCWSILNMQ